MLAALLSVDCGSGSLLPSYPIKAALEHANMEKSARRVSYIMDVWSPRAPAYNGTVRQIVFAIAYIFVKCPICTVKLRKHGTSLFLRTHV